jgi:hypothetical protein
LNKKNEIKSILHLASRGRERERRRRRRRRRSNKQTSAQNK